MSTIQPDQSATIPKVDAPFGFGFSAARLIVILCTMILIGLEIGIMVPFIKSPIGWFAFACLITTIYLYVKLGKDESVLKETTNKLGFIYRDIRRRERLMMYDEKTSLKDVQSFTPYVDMDPDGLIQLVDDVHGNWGALFAVYPPSEKNKNSFNTLLEQALKTIPVGCMQIVITLMGEDIEYIISDIDKYLQDKNLPKILQEELISLQRTFTDLKGKTSYCHFIFIGFKYTYYKERAQTQMMEVMEGYIDQLKRRLKFGVKLITTEDDLIAVYQSAISSAIFYRGR